MRNTCSGACLARGEKKIERVEFRATRSWTKRAIEAAERKGLDISSYIRMAVIERCNQDGIPQADDIPDSILESEAAKPKNRKGKK